MKKKHYINAQFFFYLFEILSHDTDFYVPVQLENISL